MEASRSKGMSNLGSAASRVAAVGKENICPLSSRESAAANRSPLPEGFPRAPLQDITQVVCPINVLLNDEDETERGLCRPCRKRSKFVSEMQTSCSMIRCDTELDATDRKWSGLRKCATSQAAKGNVHVKDESKLTESIEIQDHTCLTEGVEVDDQAKVAIDVASEDLAPLQGDLIMEMRETEHTLFTELVSTEEWELKTGVVESSSRVGLLEAIPKKSRKPSLASPTTRAGLRSAQKKPKMSNLMKFR